MGFQRWTRKVIAATVAPADSPGSLAGRRGRCGSVRVSVKLAIACFPPYGAPRVPLQPLCAEKRSEISGPLALHYCPRNNRDNQAPVARGTIVD